ncbi:MAG: hypothetical protein HYZ53_31245 [Planctomycetes bacterium]|nr:hypothetical protein [Planctomycetota bacterium]
MIGALLSREADGDASSLRMAVARTLTFGGVFVAVAVASARLPLDDGGLARLPLYGHQVFTLLSWALAGSVLLLGPALTADSVSRERRKGTLQLLFLTGLTPLGIAVGKMLGRFLALATLVLSTLPVVVFLSAYGGVRAVEVVAVYATCLAAAAWACGVGIAAAALFEDGAVGMVVSFGALAVYVGFPLAGAGSLAPGGALPWWSPLSALYNALVLRALGSADFGFDAPWVLGDAFLLAQAAGLTVVGALLLPRPLAKAAPLAGWLDRTSAPLGLLLPWFIPATEEIPDLEVAARGPNPFAWREACARSRAGLRSVLLLAALVVAAMHLAYRYAGALLEEPSFHLVFTLVLSGMAVLIATVLAAASIASEKEDKTIETFALLDLPPYRYLEGKFLGLFWMSGVLAVPAVLHCTNFALVGVLPPWCPVLVAVGLVAMIGCAVAQALYFSLRCRTSLRAFVASSAAWPILLVLQLAGVPLCGAPLLVNPWALVLVALMPDLLPRETPLWFGWPATAILAGLVYRLNRFYIRHVLLHASDQFAQRVAEHVEG